MKNSMHTLPVEPLPTHFFFTYIPIFPFYKIKLIKISLLNKFFISS